MLNPFNDVNFPIIFIDDEEKSVKYFQKIFGNEFNVIATIDPQEALEIIDSRPGEIAVIISDQKMPQGSGVDLLSKIKEKDSNIIRILTTAYTDLQANIDAINKSNVFAYLTKPWDLTQVSEILRRALAEFKARRNYLSLSGSIAHEMRNPLNSVRQSTSFIKEKLLAVQLAEKFCCEEPDKKIMPIAKKDFHEIVESIDLAFSSAKRGNVLIDIILDSIRQKPLDTKSFKDFSISEVIDSVMMEYSFRANEKEKIVIDVKPEHDFSIRGNDILLNYVFFNLLKNSLYYLNSHPHLTISISAKTGEDGFNHIHVRDNGPGIPESKLHGIFSDFSTAGKDGGTGLGLSFCRRAMTNFGGTIICISKEGEFCEFILSFPKFDKKAKEQSANRLLLIGAQQNGLLAVKKLLEKNLQSADCDLAESDLQAAELANKNGYDLILIDMETSEIDGFSLAKKIREFDQTVPIIAYSSEDSSALLTKLKEAGFSDYVAKQDPNLLIKIISKWSIIGLRSPFLKEGEAKEFLRNKKILLADDENVNLILTAKYLEKFQMKVDEVKDGQEALNMAKKQDYDMILMDIKMPEVDGITAAKKIREFWQENNLNPIPIIAFTGDNDREKIQEILNVGFSDYFIKGGDYSYLVESMVLSFAGAKTPS